MNRYLSKGVQAPGHTRNALSPTNGAHVTPPIHSGNEIITAKIKEYINYGLNLIAS
jgi:hypothetical protein